MSAVRRLSVTAAAGLLFSSSSSAAPAFMQRFRDQAAEVGAAARLLSAYGIVTSTFRTVAHNRAVGGVPNSYHLLDRAIDVVRRSGVTHIQMDAALRRAGYQIVESLDERDHSHFAFAAVRKPVGPTPIALKPEPPAPAAKPLPKVAADEHGTLSLDIQPATSPN
jgi:hypothetical protein